VERDFKGVWIPKEIWLDEELSIMEKMLLVEVDSLCGEKGCWATNNYLAQFLHISKDRVSKLISGLVKKNYLEITIKYIFGTKQVKERVLFTTIGYRQKQLEGIGENNDTPTVESTDTPIGENNEENNTVLNNTFINNTLNNKNTNAREEEQPKQPPIKQEVELTPLQKRFKEFWDAYPKKVGKGAAEKSYKKIKPDSDLQERIMGAIYDAKKSKDWKKDNGQYIPHPATWLNQKRWEDELDPEPEPPDGTPQPIAFNPQMEIARQAMEAIRNE
jgi:hypothetical protein